MKFAMYGSGAAGSVFASYLRKGGADIILIDRYEAHIKQDPDHGIPQRGVVPKSIVSKVKIVLGSATCSFSIKRILSMA